VKLSYCLLTWKSPVVPTIRITTNPHKNNTVVGIELILRYELKVVTTLGEVIAIAASSADNNVRIVT